MESLSSAEIMEIVTLLGASIDTQFQIWITATFAFIAATYLTRHELPNIVLYLGVALYFAIVSAVFWRWVNDGIRATALIEELSNRGIDFSTSNYAVLFRFGTFIGGSLLSIGLAFYFHFKPSSEHNVSMGT